MADPHDTRTPKDATPDPLPSSASRRRGRRWRAFLIWTVGLFALATAIYLLAREVSSSSWGDKVSVGAMTVHYPSHVARNSAEALARFLYDKGIGRINDADARLRHESGIWTVDLFIPQQENTDTDIFSALLERMHRDIARDVLHGEALVLRACHPEVGANSIQQRGDPKAWKEIGP